MTRNCQTIIKCKSSAVIQQLWERNKLKFKSLLTDSLVFPCKSPDIPDTWWRSAGTPARAGMCCKRCDRTAARAGDSPQLHLLEKNNTMYQMNKLTIFTFYFLYHDKYVNVNFNAFLESLFSHVFYLILSGLDRRKRVIT